MDEIRFADAWLLWLLLLLPVLGLLWWWRRPEPGAAIGTAASVAGLRPTWRTRLEPWLPVLRLAAVALAIVAIARPQRADVATAAEREGIDIVLAYDVSSSMSQPFARQGERVESRLDAAERVLTEFVESRQNDRVGLVAFRAVGITMSPLTTEYDALAESVATASGLRLADGTAIGIAIAQSANVLRDSDATSRIVILMTDGENNVDEIEPLAAARLAESLGVRVYTIGVVSPEPGRRSTINVDEASLREIAEVTGGSYSRAENPEALAEIYATIDRLERSRFVGEEIVRLDDIAHWVLAAAIVVLAVEFAARYGILRRAA